MDLLQISNTIALPIHDIEFSAIRAQGAGGQNVNKVSTAIHLRFDIKNSSLSDFYKSRLLKLKDQRISKEGIIIIKAQQYRSQEKNKEDALKRLKKLIKSVTILQKKRTPTTPTKSSQKKRLNSKTKRGITKNLRKKIAGEEY